MQEYRGALPLAQLFEHSCVHARQGFRHFHTILLDSDPDQNARLIALLNRGGLLPLPYIPVLLVIRRSGNFNAFETPAFSAKVEDTDRKNLIMAGLMTEGCLLLTALDGLRPGFDVYTVVDALSRQHKRSQ